MPSEENDHTTYGSIIPAIDIRVVVCPTKNPKTTARFGYVVVAATDFENKIQKNNLRPDRGGQVGECKWRGLGG